MTTTDVRPPRVDLFTDIHKALRKGLFDMSIAAGATDWTTTESVAPLASRWAALADLLRAHTDHENRYIFRLLDDTSAAADLPEDGHRELDDLLDDLSDQFAVLTADPDPIAGLTWYRNLNRYVAMTLEHLHVEETTVSPALWSARTDSELEECRREFLAATPADVLHTTSALFRSALPPGVQEAMQASSDPHS